MIRSPAVQFEVPEYTPIKEYREGVIKWCDMHWADLMFALQDRGLSDFISPSSEALSQKLAKGEGDPCWDAFTRINMGAMEIFGPSKIVDGYDGCPVCAFSKMTEHVADLVTPTYKDPH